ncbi:MAG TPA: hypothetical protein VGA00_14685 [Acidiferrobacterales bacterium]
MRNLWVGLVAVVTVSGCVTHAVTSGRVTVRDDRGVVAVGFSTQDRRIIEEYYRAGGRVRTAPPGLAKRDALPPGLARRDRLPPGLEGRVLPSDLERRLGPVPYPYVRLRVGADIVLMDRNTRVLVDILYDVVP